MAAPIDTRQISQCILYFKNADPRVYEALIRLMDAYTTELTVAVTEAAPADILVAQGRAQQARKYLQLFTELPTPAPTPKPATV